MTIAETTEAAFAALKRRLTSEDHPRFECPACRTPWVELEEGEFISMPVVREIVATVLHRFPSQLAPMAGKGEVVPTTWLVLSTACTHCGDVRLWSLTALIPHLRPGDVPEKRS